VILCYPHTILQANPEGVKEATDMKVKSLEQVLEDVGLKARFEARGVEKGIQLMASLWRSGKTLDEALAFLDKGKPAQSDHQSV
jgi:hypothetical protein